MMDAFLSCMKENGWRIEMYETKLVFISRFLYAVNLGYWCYIKSYFPCLSSGNNP